MRGLKYKSEGENADILCRTLHGVRGLKYMDIVLHRSDVSRAPHGVRGLKYRFERIYTAHDIVAPRMGCVD